MFDVDSAKCPARAAAKKGEQYVRSALGNDYVLGGSPVPTFTVILVGFLRGSRVFPFLMPSYSVGSESEDAILE